MLDRGDRGVSSIETSFEVGSDESSVVAVFSKGSDFLFEFFSESVLVVVSRKRKKKFCSSETLIGT